MSNFFEALHIDTSSFLFDSVDSYAHLSRCLISVTQRKCKDGRSKRERASRRDSATTVERPLGTCSRGTKKRGSRCERTATFTTRIYSCIGSYPLQCSLCQLPLPSKKSRFRRGSNWILRQKYIKRWDYLIIIDIWFRGHVVISPWKR